VNQHRPTTGYINADKIGPFLCCSIRSNSVLIRPWSRIPVSLPGWPQTSKTWNTRGFLWTWKTRGILRELCATSVKTDFALWVHPVSSNPYAAKCIWCMKCMALEKPGKLRDFLSYFVAILSASDFEFTECVLMLRVISNGYDSRTAYLSWILLLVHRRRQRLWCNLSIPVTYQSFHFGVYTSMSQSCSLWYQ